MSILFSAIRQERQTLKRWHKHVRRVMCPKGFDHVGDGIHGILGQPFGVIRTIPAGPIWKRTGGKTWKVTFIRAPQRVVELIAPPGGP